MAETHKTDFHFYRAIRKHGWDNFEWSVLKEDATMEDEKYFIKEYDTFGENGYNTTFGGEGPSGRICTVEHKRKTSESMKGRTHSIETKQKMSAAKMGKIFSVETRKKIGDAGRGKTYSKETKKKMSEWQKSHKYGAKTYVVSSNIESRTIFCLKTFCEEQNWPYDYVCKMARNNKPYKGYTIKEKHNVF